jgi:hypothetical protein
MKVRTRCFELCAHHCRIKDGHRGICAVRENRKGVLYSLVYGWLVAEHVDPIEKNPYFMFCLEVFHISYPLLAAIFVWVHYPGKQAC